LTIEFNRPVADYQTALVVAVPAHSLAQQTFGSENLENSQADTRVVDAIQNQKSTNLKPWQKHIASAIS